MYWIKSNSNLNINSTIQPSTGRNHPLRHLCLPSNVTSRHSYLENNSQTLLLINTLVDLVVILNYLGHSKKLCFIDWKIWSKYSDSSTWPSHPGSLVKFGTAALWNISNVTVHIKHTIRSTRSTQNLLALCNIHCQQYNHLPNFCSSVLWHCWLGHMTGKIILKMTYNVCSGTLNHTMTMATSTTIIYSKSQHIWRNRVCCTGIFSKFQDPQKLNRQTTVW